jgi:hypothetical protein
MPWTPIGGHPAMGGQMVWCEPARHLVREGRDFSKASCDGIGCDKEIDKFKCRHIRYSPCTNTEARLYRPRIEEIIKKESIKHADNTIGQIILYQGIEPPYSFNLCEDCYTKATSLVFGSLYKFIGR